MGSVMAVYQLTVVKWGGYPDGYLCIETVKQCGSGPPGEWGTGPSHPWRYALFHGSVFLVHTYVLISNAFLLSLVDSNMSHLGLGGILLRNKKCWHHTTPNGNSPHEEEQQIWFQQQGMLEEYLHLFLQCDPTGGAGCGVTHSIFHAFYASKFSRDPG